MVVKLYSGWLRTLISITTTLLIANYAFTQEVPKSPDTETSKPLSESTVRGIIQDLTNARIGGRYDEWKLNYDSLVEIMSTPQIREQFGIGERELREISDALISEYRAYTEALATECKNTSVGTGDGPAPVKSGSDFKTISDREFEELSPPDSVEIRARVDMYLRAVRAAKQAGDQEAALNIIEKIYTVLSLTESRVRNYEEMEEAARADRAVRLGGAPSVEGGNSLGYTKISAYNDMHYVRWKRDEARGIVLEPDSCSGIGSDSTGIRRPSVCDPVSECDDGWLCEPQDGESCERWGEQSGLPCNAPRPENFCDPNRSTDEGSGTCLPGTICDKRVATGSAGLDWLLGTWKHRYNEGAIEFRLAADGTAEASIKTLNKRMEVNGYSAGMLVARGWQAGCEYHNIWKACAVEGEFFLPKLPDKEPHQFRGKPEWKDTGLFTVSKETPGVLGIPPEFSGWIGAYSGELVKVD